MVLPTIAWALLHQVAVKTVSYRHVSSMVRSRQFFSWGLLFTGDSRLSQVDNKNWLAQGISGINTVFEVTEQEYEEASELGSDVSRVMTAIRKSHLLWTRSPTPWWLLELSDWTRCHSLGQCDPWEEEWWLVIRLHISVQGAQGTQEKPALSCLGG